jgi:hypothetical protein
MVFSDALNNAASRKNRQSKSGHAFAMLKRGYTRRTVFMQESEPRHRFHKSKLQVAGTGNHR